MFPDWLVLKAQGLADRWAMAASEYGSNDQEHEIGNEMAALLGEIVREENVDRAQKKADARLGLTEEV